MSEKPGGGEPENEGSVDFPGRMLHQAAIYNNTEFLASLLEGDDLEHIDAQDGFGRTALYTCITNNSLECARMLLQHNGEWRHTVRCRYDAVHFLQNPHNRHPIARPRYGMSVVILKYNSLSATVIAVLYVILW